MAILDLFGRLSILLVFSLVLPLRANAAPPPPPLSLYGNLPGFETASLSPSGDRIALIGVVGEERRLIVIDRSNKPLSTVPLGTQKVSDLTWAGDETLLIGLRATAELGIEFVQSKIELETYVVLPIAPNAKLWEVFKGNWDVTGGVRGFYGVAQRDGRWYGYFSGITMQRNVAAAFLESTAPELYEVDFERRIARRVEKRLDAETGYRSWRIDETGRVVGTFDRYLNSGNWRLRNAEGAIVASGQSHFDGVGLIGLGRVPNSLLYSIEDPTSGERRWMEVVGTQATEILAGKAIYGRLSDRRTGQLIGYMEEGDVPAPRFFDARRTKVFEGTKRAFPGMNVRLVSANDAFDRLIVTTDGPGDSGTWWLVDIKTGDASELGRSYPMKADQVGPVRVVHYKATDGLDLSGILTLPPGREPKDLPVVMLPHGGPASRDYPGFDWWAQALASRGYAVFQPNFRGSTGFGPAFERAGHAEWGRKMQSDISDGLADLARQGIVDPKRACIMGGSYGGYAALAGVTLQQGLYRCAVSVAGVSDVARMAATDKREGGSRNNVLRRALDTQIGSGRDLKLISPANFAEKADAPILLIHGKDDTVVYYEQSQIMLSALKKAGKPAELVTLADEDHWLSRGSTRLVMLQAAVAFIQKHNPADPAK